MPKHQRLKSARIRAGYKTAREAAARLNVPYGTYSGHESGSRGIKEEEIKKYADFFQVSATWLLFGQEEDLPKIQKFVIISGKSGKTSDGSIDFLSNDQIDIMPVDLSADVYDKDGNIIGNNQYLPMPYFMAPALNAFPKAVAIKIDGDKLKKNWEDGSVLYFDNIKYEDLDGFRYSECICWLANGAAVIGKPLVSRPSDKKIMAVSPLIMHLTRAGQTLWLEALAATFMQAAQNSSR